MENARIADRAVGRREDDGRRDERGAAVTGESEDPPRGSESSPRSRTREYDTIGDRMSTVSATCQVLELECLPYEKIKKGDKWDGVCINCMVDFLKRMPDITPRYCRPVCINEG